MQSNLKFFGVLLTKKIVKPKKNKLIRILWILLGSLFVGIGYLGIFVPGLPTTIFLILAAGCYIRSSEKLYNWLINNKIFGQYIKDYYEGRGMPLKSKILALSMIIIFCSFAIFFVVELIWVQLIIGLAGVIGISYITLRVPTKK
ncbi:MAG: hypothetical protein CL761_05015 [Chloroflexi bacterium]|nr:hypothetical protein [Chloroflexota bacterium]